MKNFSFDLTPAQVNLVNDIINETFVRLSHAAVVRKEITGKEIIYDSALIDVQCLKDELDLQVSNYLFNFGVNSISELDDNLW